MSANNNVAQRIRIFVANAEFVCPGYRPILHRSLKKLCNRQIDRPLASAWCRSLSAVFGAVGSLRGYLWGLYCDCNVEAMMAKKISLAVLLWGRGHINPSRHINPANVKACRSMMTKQCPPPCPPQCPPPCPQLWGMRKTTEHLTPINRNPGA